MSQASANSNTDSRLLGILLMPSWLSAGLILLSSLAICFGTIALSRYQASTIRLDYLSYQAGDVTQTYQKLNDRLFASNTFLGNLPLLIFWGLVGLVVYLFVVNLLGALRGTAELKTELHYVHADRRQVLWQPLEHLLVHLVVLAAWTGYILFFFHHILPYCVAASIIGSGTLSTLQNGAYALLAVTIMSLALHVHVVLLRLLLLRPRLFSSALYVDIHQPLA